MDSVSENFAASNFAVGKFAVWKTRRRKNQPKVVFATNQEKERKNKIQNYNCYNGVMECSQQNSDGYDEN